MTKIIFLVATSVYIKAQEPLGGCTSENMSKFYDVSIIKQESYLVQVGGFRAKD